MSDLLRDFVGDWHALVLLVVAGAIPNQIWRMLAYGSAADWMRGPTC